MDAPMCRDCDTRHWSRQPCAGKRANKQAAVTHVTHAPAAAVTHAESPAARRARWRKAHPDLHRAQQRDYRSRKAAKAAQ